MPKSSVLRSTVLLACLLVAPVPAFAQESKPATPEPQPSSTPSERPSEPELNLINIGTTRSLDRNQGYFRITHRFARDLRNGSFGSLVEDLFSLDNGAVIGLEYRHGITNRLQAGVSRTALGKTIQFLGRYDALKQGDAVPISLSVLGSVEGLQNFHENRQPALGATVARAASSWLMLYASPTFVWNTQAVDFLEGHDHDHDLPGAEEDEHSQHEHTLFVGLGARVRLRPTTYLVGEYSPRLAGHDPNKAVWGGAIEFATHGHTFQINFTNSFGTLPGQIARGGSAHDVYLGFNITRRF